LVLIVFGVVIMRRGVGLLMGSATSPGKPEMTHVVVPGISPAYSSDIHQSFHTRSWTTVNRRRHQQSETAKVGVERSRRRGCRASVSAFLTPSEQLTTVAVSSTQLTEPPYPSQHYLFVLIAIRTCRFESSMMLQPLFVLSAV
jgi:hypothetical protein